MAASPSSSPRLPSPPPIAEDQLGPKSPITMPNEHGELGRNPFEANASRRIRPGTKAADMALGPPLVPLTDIDSPFQLTEHLKSLHNAALHRDGSSTISPIDRKTATRLAQPPDGVDKYLWLYELCRLLCKEINAMIVALFQDDPPCSAQTCNEMRASEWQYLCAVHDPPKPCCAIDYCCHTLDWTNHVLTSQKNFPSRMTLGGADSGSGHQQLRQLTNIFRRVYRIFAHAWFQHREMYWKVELKSGLYVFFKTVCDVYNLIPEDNYTVPPEAEGIEPTVLDTKKSGPSIMKRKEDNSEMDHERTEGEKVPSLKAPTSTGSTTQRHRHTPSIGSESITTVLEDPEEEDEKAEHENLEETVILSGEPPKDDSAAEASKEESTTTTADHATEDKEEPLSTSEAAVPLIAIEPPEEPAAHPVEASTSSESEAAAAAEDAPELQLEPEPEGHAETGEEKDQPVPSSASDTDSQGSWQVLTDEGTQQQSSSSRSPDEATPASSTTEVEGEGVGGESDSSLLLREQEVEHLAHVGLGLSKELGEDLEAETAEKKATETEEQSEEKEKEEDGKTIEPVVNSTEKDGAKITAVSEKETLDDAEDDKSVTVLKKELEEGADKEDIDSTEAKADPKADAKDAEEATKTVDD